MVERFFSLFSRFDADSKRFLHFILADVLSERLRSKDVLLATLFVRGAIGEEPFGHGATPILLALRHLLILRGRRQSSLTRLGRTAAIRRTSLISLRRVRKILHHFPQLTLRHPTTVF